MKNKNPFMLWGERTADLGGRKTELMIFRNFLDAVESGGGRESAVLIINGSRGSGKTALLNKFVKETEDRGMLVSFAQVERGEHEAELAIDAIEVLDEEAGIAAQQITTLSETGQVLAEAAHEKNTTAVIFIDDADRLFKAKETIRKICTDWKRSTVDAGGAGLVIALGKSVGDFSAGATVLRLGPIELHDAQELVRRALKDSEIEMSEECVAAILEDTGGNLRLFKTICWYEYEMLKGNEKIITRGHYLAYLPSLMSLLARDWFGSIYYDTPAAERAVLSVLSGKNAEDGLAVSEIAKALGKPLGQVTVLVGRLVDRGEIVRIERGRYRIFSRLYGRYVGQRTKTR